MHTPLDGCSILARLLPRKCNLSQYPYRDCFCLSSAIPLNTTAYRAGRIQLLRCSDECEANVNVRIKVKPPPGVEPGNSRLNVSPRSRLAYRGSSSSLRGITKSRRHTPYSGPGQRGQRKARYLFARLLPRQFHVASEQEFITKSLTRQ